jgi:hypothetical protein
LLIASKFFSYQSKKGKFMTRQIFTQNDLDEAKAAFRSALQDLYSGKETNTGKGSSFDVTLNKLLSVAFVFAASNENAKIVPLHRPDISKFLQGGLQQVLDFRWTYSGPDVYARRLGGEESSLYAVPLMEGSLNIDEIPYSTESQTLGKAYDQAKHLAESQIGGVLGVRQTSKLACNLQRILDKKTHQGKLFLMAYLDIIAPESETPLSGFPTFQQLVEERIQSLTSTTLADLSTDAFFAGELMRRQQALGQQH